MRCVMVNERKGHVAAAMFVAPEDEILLISAGGVVIRTAVADISQQGRDATGVRVMNLGASDQVSAVARLFKEENGNGSSDGEVDASDGADDPDAAGSDAAAAAAAEPAESGPDAGPASNGSSGGDDA